MDEIEFCWNCAESGVLEEWCISCDKAHDNCLCVDPHLWDHFRCPRCRATW